MKASQSDNAHVSTGGAVNAHDSSYGTGASGMSAGG